MQTLYLQVDHDNEKVTALQTQPDNRHESPEYHYADLLAQKKRWETQGHIGHFQLGAEFYNFECVPLSERVDLFVLSRGTTTNADDVATLEAFTLAGKVFDHCKSANDLCFQAVKFSQDLLKIDRTGVLLLSENKEQIIGTWGTNVKGEIVNESDLSLPLAENPWMEEALAKHGALVVKEDIALLDYGKAVGKGWNAIISIYYGHEPLGWFCCDNLITQQPMTLNLRSQITHFATMVGQWLIRKKNEESLRLMNEYLEVEVKDKTAELQNTIKALTRTQSDLVNTERTKALASFTAGIAHEINNPLGFIRSNLSFIGKVSSKVLTDIDSEDQTARERSLKMLKEIDVVIDESVEGLDRVSNIISMLQPLNKLADEAAQDFNLQEAIEFAVMGLDNPNAKIDIRSGTPGIKVKLPLQIFTLAFENVMENALNAIKNTESARIIVEIQHANGELEVAIQDNGAGIKPEDLNSIFTPFFTTKAPGEGLGLGLSLSDNLIQLANGRMAATSELGAGTTMKISFNEGVIVHG